MIFLDTCALLRNAFEKKSLSSTAKRFIKQADGFIISSISIWEIGIKVKKGKLQIPMSIEEFTSNLREIDSFHILPLDETIWIESLHLEWDHKDPVDRVIVASALLKNADLLTSDKMILDFYSKAWW